ncbi:MAG: hypothetical protein SFY92_10485 [Verrucomicrobiae bacterium]|nr:hypothetical protein [Verrucomicrobiae bacterium]
MAYHSRYVFSPQAPPAYTPAVPTATPTQATQAEVINYGDPIEVAPGITISLREVTLVRDSAKITIDACFQVENKTPEDYKVDPRLFDMVDERGYSYLRESDKVMLEQNSSRYKMFAGRTTDVEIGFFVDREASFQQFYILLNNKRILIKNTGPIQAQMLIGEKVKMNRADW